MKIINNIKKNTIVLLIITIIVLYVVLKDDFNGIVDSLARIDLKFVVISLVFYFLSISIKGFVNYLITNDKEKISLKEAIKHNLITQFFNGVTPFSTGGQPMEVYMITEHGISLPKATNQSVQSFIFYQIALVICGALAVLYNFFFHIFPKVKILQHLVLLGFIINIAVVIGLLLISSSKGVTKKLSKLFYKVARKFKLKVNEKELEKKFDDYYKGFKELKGRKNLTIVGICLNIASLLCLYVVPFFIVCGMGDFTSLNIADTLTSSAYVYLIGAFVPIPGASGGMEYGFTQFYGNFINIREIAVTLIVWRFITYYLGVILGGLLFSLEEKVKK